MWGFERGPLIGWGRRGELRKKRRHKRERRREGNVLEFSGYLKNPPLIKKHLEVTTRSLRRMPVSFQANVNQKDLRGGDRMVAVRVDHSGTGRK